LAHGDNKGYIPEGIHHDEKRNKGQNEVVPKFSHEPYPFFIPEAY
jgi:hypothetical protein